MAFAFRGLLLALGLAAAGFGWVAGAVLAQTAAPAPIGQSDTIQDIRVEGIQRVERETVLSYLNLKVGDVFSADRIDAALKSLFATGLFADASLRREGKALVVQVVENPIINRIAFEGNDRIDDEELSAEVQLRPRVVYTRTRVQNDVQRILEIYRRSGRFAATVEPKVIELDQNRVDLVFEIDEGTLTGIKAINFVGNREYSDGSLRDEIVTSESAWWRILSTSDTYDPDRLTADQELLRRFYLKNGYADFRVLSAVAELAPDRDGFIITFTVEEGDRYKFGPIDVATTLKNLDPASLRSKVTTEEGDWYNAEEVDQSISALTDAVGDLGYAFVDVRPVVQRDRDKRLIAITYDIQEGPRVYVERIDIRGNVRTQDKVVRREFRLVEGDAFNTTKLRRSRQRVENLGYFSKVDVKTTPGSAADQTVVEVDVEEQSTGELSVGAGFSTTEGPLADISLRERNLLGRGQDLRLGFNISGRRSQLDLSYTEPYFLDKNLSAGFDLFRIATDYQESSYNQESYGGSLRTGYELTESLRQTLRYTLRRDDITDVENDASTVIRDEEGIVWRSIVGQELFYDKLNSRLDPTDGYFARLQNDVAGLGGDARFVRSRVSGGYYLPLTRSLVAMVSSEAGYIFGLSDDVRVSDRFFLGGDSFRGFAPSGVGPRDKETHDALGGNILYAGTAELSFPLGFPEEFQIRGRVFSDVGTLTKIDGSTNDVEDSASLRASAGIGLTWRSPFGPIAIDLARPYLEETFDETEVFRFSFGTRF